MARISARLTAAVTALAALSILLVAVRDSPARVKPTPARAAARDSDKREDFMRRVYEAQVRRAGGRRFFADLPEEELEEVEHGYKMRREAAEQCRLLLAQARSDLRRQKQQGNQEALAVSDIGIYSAYRSVEHDMAAWRSAFRKHFNATKNDRAELKGGEYGDEAVELMVGIMRKFKAAPGFSRHTSGAAVDLKTTEGGVLLAADSNQNSMWKRSWFHKWLVKNAGRYKFKPLATEAWHWEHAK